MTQRVVAVLPFAAEEVDPDAYDLARWLAADVAAELSVPNVIEARLVVDVIEISPYALGEAALQLKAEAASRRRAGATRPIQRATCRSARRASQPAK